MTYETPELFELGDAEDLTLCGNCGFQLDFCDLPRIDCQEPPPQVEEME
jgi:hypothetical protein